MVLPLAVILWWVFGSYYNINIFASISYFSDDGWCNSQVIGNHCFGDYFYLIRLFSRDNPWDGFIGTNPLPGLGYFPIGFTNFLGNLFHNENLGFWIFQFSLFLSLSIPAIWASRGMDLERRALIFLIIGPASMPALVALDRGNPVGFLAPVLLWFIVSVERSNKAQVVLAIVIASALKPHFIALIIILISLKWWKETIAGLLSFLTLQVLGFLLWPSDFPQSIISFLEMAKSFQTYNPVEKEYPGGISFAEGVYIIEGFIRTNLHSFGVIGSPSYLSVRFTTAIGFTILCMVSIAVICARRKIPTLLASTLMISTISMAPGTSNPYYSVFGLAVASILIRTPNSETISSTPKMVQISLVIATTITMIWLPIPAVLSVGEFGLIKTSIGLIPVSWLLTILISILYMVKARKIEPNYHHQAVI